MTIKFPCKVCKKSVNKNHKAVYCDLCNEWVHMKCSLLDDKTYKLLQNDSNPWFCLICNSSIFPFQEESFGSQNSQSNLTKTQQEIIDKLNRAMDEEDNLLTCSYLLPDELNKSNCMSNKTSIFHLNISSLPFHIEELSSFLQTNKLAPTILGITESRLKKGFPPIVDISIPDYNIEHTTTESSNGGALLYIAKNISYKPRQDLLLYKSKELESVFIEIITKGQKEKNIIVGCIYKHPHMCGDEFNDTHLKNLLTNLRKENKEIILMGDFNLDLLKYDNCSKISNFLDMMYSNSLFPYITGPTRITDHSQTLIDNIFSSFLLDNVDSGNIVTTISDHLCQFLVLPIVNKQYKKEVNMEGILELVTLIN